MKKRVSLTLLMIVMCAAVFALPPGLVDPAYDGDIGGGLLVQFDPLAGTFQYGFDLYYLSKASIGAGFTFLFDLSKRDGYSSYSLDALWYPEIGGSSGGRLVAPVKFRIGYFNPEGFGLGIAAGVEYYAFPLGFDANDNIIAVPAAEVNNAGFFATFKAMAEVDFAGFLGQKFAIKPELQAGSSLIGTVGGDSSGGGGYVIWVYY